MILSSIRFYEGNNIKRTKNIVKINIENVQKSGIYEYLSNYFKSSFLLGFKEKLIDIEIGESSEIWVTYTQEEVSKCLLKNLFYGESINTSVRKAEKFVKYRLITEIIRRAKNFDIPYIKLTEDMFQLGYGKNSVIMGSQYQSFENMTDIMICEDRSMLLQHLKYNNMLISNSKVVYCKDELNDPQFPMIIKSINKLNDFSVYIKNEEQLNENIESIIDKHGGVVCFSGDTYYKIICIKGKPIVAFEIFIQSQEIKEVSISKDMEIICNKAYNQFKINFMYIYAAKEDSLKIADIGSLFCGHINNAIQTKIADTILASLKKEGIGFIPIVSVTGTNGKTTTSKVIYHILSNFGLKTALTCTGGIFLGDLKIKSGDTTGFLSAREVLKNSMVEAAVFETARGGIYRNGLGYDGAKAAIITSLSEDHIGMDGIRDMDDLIHIKSVILDEVKKDGRLILRAKKEVVSAYQSMKKDIPINRVCLFDISKNIYIDTHVQKGGEALYLEDNIIIHCKDGMQKKIINIDEIPFTYNGISKGNSLNIISAIAAVSDICNDMEKVINILRKLQCDMYINPGRQNLLQITKFKVILDYGHNPEAFEEVFNLAKNLNGSKIISIVAAPGDRLNKYIKQLGIISAQNSDYVIVREQADLRERKKGESASLIKEGLIEAGMSCDKINVIYKEEEALLYAMENAEEGDIIILFTQCLDVIMPVINKFLISKGENPIYQDIDFEH